MGHIQSSNLLSMLEKANYLRGFDHVFDQVSISVVESRLGFDTIVKGLGLFWDCSVQMEVGDPENVAFSVDFPLIYFSKQWFKPRRMHSLHMVIVILGNEHLSGQQH